MHRQQGTAKRGAGAGGGGGGRFAAKRACGWRVHGTIDSGQGSRDVFWKASMKASAIVRCKRVPGCVWSGAVAVCAACFTCRRGGMNKLWIE